VAGAVPERRAAGPLAQLAAGFRRSFDHLSSSSRRKRADRLFADLAHGRIATVRASRELAAVCEEQKQ
jgi:hypothetical protein